MNGKESTRYNKSSLGTKGGRKRIKKGERRKGRRVCRLSFSGSFSPEKSALLIMRDHMFI